MITVEQIRELCRNLDNVEFSGHALLRFSERKIMLNDILRAIKNGEMIEQYPNDYPSPSCLVLGLSANDTPLHVVCGIGSNKLWIITAYFPALDTWECDFKTRKAVL